MKTYNVSWNIELDAESAQQAAELALEMHRDKNSTATIFEVTDDDKGTLDVIDASPASQGRETTPVTLKTIK